MEYDPDIITSDLFRLKMRYGEDGLTNIINNVSIDDPKLFRTCDKYGLSMEEYGICRLAKESVLHCGEGQDGGGHLGGNPALAQLARSVTKMLPHVIKGVGEVGNQIIKHRGTIVKGAEAVGKQIVKHQDKIEKAAKIVSEVAVSLANKLKDRLEIVAKVFMEEISKSNLENDIPKCIESITSEEGKELTDELIARKLFETVEGYTNADCPAVNKIRNALIKSIKAGLNINVDPDSKLVKELLSIVKEPIVLVLAKIIGSARKKTGMTPVSATSDSEVLYDTTKNSKISVAPDVTTRLREASGPNVQTNTSIETIIDKARNILNVSDMSEADTEEILREAEKIVGNRRRNQVFDK